MTDENHEHLTPEERKAMMADLSRFNQALTTIYAKTTEFTQSFAQDFDLVGDMLSEDTRTKYQDLVLAIFRTQGVMADLVAKYGDDNNEEEN